MCDVSFFGIEEVTQYTAKDGSSSSSSRWVLSAAFNLYYTLTANACAYVCVRARLALYGFRSHNTLIYLRVPHANVCIKLLGWYLFAWFFLRFAEHAAGKCRWPLPHSHKTPYRSNFLRFCGSCFDYVSQCSRFHASSMVVKTWLLWTLLALIEFQLNDNKFKRTLHQYPFHSKSNMSRVTSSRVHFILFHFILP